MRYASIRELDISNGEGVGVSLFVQGCHFHCKGCFNSETWNFNGGNEWTEEIEKQFLQLIDRPYIKRISILGGEPLANENINDVIKLVKKCKLLFPDKKIWLWSGNDFLSYISSLDIINYVDYIIDGKYINELKDFNLLFRGSSNQHIWKKDMEDVWHLEN